MIKYILITGDLHGRLARCQKIDESYLPEETALIVLGDAGFNYYLDERDIKMKNEATRLGYTFYCVRGNHEAPPQDLPQMKLIHDEVVKGEVYQEPDYPNIKYFQDTGVYTIGGKETLVIGGAYSVDKEYRLMCGWQWFENEQLSPGQREELQKYLTTRFTENKPHFNLVLTHTCPASIEPTELFLSMIDQSKVDKTMEHWLENIFNHYITYDFHLFGHFHGNKIVNRNTAMLYDKVLDLSMINPIEKDDEIPEGFYLDKDFY